MVKHFITAVIAAMMAACVVPARADTDLALDKMCPATNFEKYFLNTSVTEMTPDDSSVDYPWDTYWCLLDGATTVIPAEQSAGLATVTKYAAGEGNFAPELRPALYSNDVSNTKYLSISTAGETLFRTVLPYGYFDGTGSFSRTHYGTDDPPYLSSVSLDAVDGKTLYFDTMVEFIATPEYQPLDGDEKIQIYLHEDETSGETNIVVVSGYMGPSDTEVQIVTNRITSVDVADGSWHRVTIVAEEGEAGPEGMLTTFFTLYLDSTVRLKTSDGTWKFMSLARSGGVTLRGIGFRGTGSIDDIVITDENPLPEIPAVQVPVTFGEHITSVTVYDQTFTSSPGTYNAQSEDEKFKKQSITAEMDDGWIPYIQHNGEEIRLDRLPAKTTAAALIAEGGIILSAKEYTVTVNGVGYISLFDASYSMTKDSATYEVVLQGDQDMSQNDDYCMFMSGKVIIDLNGYSIYADADTIGTVLYINGADVTIINSYTSERSYIYGGAECAIFNNSGSLTLGTGDSSADEFTIGNGNSTGYIFVIKGALQVLGGWYKNVPTYDGVDEVPPEEYAPFGYSLQQTVTSDPYYELAPALYMQLDETEVLTYTGAALAPTRYVYFGERLLNKSDYTVSYTDVNGDPVSAVIDAGDYTITASGLGDYEGYGCSADFTVNPASIADATVTFTPEQGVYTGTDATPEVTVTLELEGKDVTLVADTDYTLAWNPAEVVTRGRYTLTVTGIGNFTGTVKAYFTVGEKTTDPATVDGVEYDTPDDVLAAANSTTLMAFPDSWEVDTATATITYGGATATFPEYYDLVAVEDGYALVLNELALPDYTEETPLAVEDDAFVVSITGDSQYTTLWYRLEQYDPIDADDPCAVSDWVEGKAGETLSIARPTDATRGFYRIAVTDVPDKELP